MDKILAKLKEPSTIGGLTAIVSGVLSWLNLSPELAAPILTAISAIAGIWLVFVKEKKPSA